MVLEEITYQVPYYRWTYMEAGISPEQYDKFINWVSGEFDLCLQEEHNGLKVYHPNGWLQIANTSKEPEQVCLQIIIHNKSKKAVELLSKELNVLYNACIFMYDPIQKHQKEIISKV
ncbi:hypothetical protein [Seonamhaeicola sp.]|uniref:hypothetical protein n=1 Tax=Seonamhaeicola sp. TaxID=1912245 RepID=UPI002627C2C5|nr:hypothetical protein [Seonamhaeicola sp.]